MNHVNCAIMQQSVCLHHPPLPTNNYTKAQPKFQPGHKKSGLRGLIFYVAPNYIVSIAPMPPGIIIMMNKSIIMELSPLKSDPPSIIIISISSIGKLFCGPGGL